MKKLLVVCGPTATGKTRAGIELAKKFNGEIVSADSRQVYRGMDIGTGKDLPENSEFRIQNSELNQKDRKIKIGYYEIAGVKVWLYDVVSPDYQFSVADYVICAQTVIDDIWKRGKLPIVVGGTGFYLKALSRGVGTMGIPPDWKLRKELSNLKVGQLSKILKDTCLERWGEMNDSDRSNPRRLIRAIEVANHRLISNNLRLKNNQLIKSDILWLGLRCGQTDLYKKIDRRVDERVKAGLEEEIKKLLNHEYKFENSALGTTIGYREWELLFKARQKGNKELLRSMRKEIIQRWKFNEHAYARRQMTWFKKEKSINWFAVSAPGWELVVEKLVSVWYTRN